MMSGIPPEGTLAGMLPPQGYHTHHPQHDPPNSKPPPTSVHSPYMPVPLKDSRNAMAGMANGGSLGIPVSGSNFSNEPNSGVNAERAFGREGWNRNSQGRYGVSISSFKLTSFQNILSKDVCNN